MSDPHPFHVGQPHGTPPQYPTSLVPPADPRFTTPGSASDPLNRTALAFAALATIAGPVSGVLRSFLLSRGDYDIAVLLPGVTAVVLFLAGLAAVTLATMALRRSGSRLLPCIAIGIVGATVVTQVAGWGSSLVYSYF
ncbi:hypothetical protein [Microbacterium sp. NPDC057944]|uniref:hypothetical protein n=1 Tax=Microbacterium sp. NPDC057944 TaxID=3346286 RepID=UPI0036DA9854